MSTCTELQHGEYEWQDPKSPDEVYVRKTLPLSLILWSTVLCIVSWLALFLFDFVHFTCGGVFFVFRVNVVYIDSGGVRHEVKGKVGDNVLYLAHRYGIEMEGLVITLSRFLPFSLSLSLSLSLYLPLHVRSRILYIANIFYTAIHVHHTHTHTHTHTHCRCL